MALNSLTNTISGSFTTALDTTTTAPDAINILDVFAMLQTNADVVSPTGSTPSTPAPSAPASNPASTLPNNAYAQASDEASEAESFEHAEVTDLETDVSLDMDSQDSFQSEGETDLYAHADVETTVWEKETAAPAYQDDAAWEQTPTSDDQAWTDTTPTQDEAPDHYLFDVHAALPVQVQVIDKEQREEEFEDGEEASWDDAEEEDVYAQSDEADDEEAYDEDEAENDGEEDSDSEAYAEDDSSWSNDQWSAGAHGYGHSRGHGHGRGDGRGDEQSHEVGREQGRAYEGRFDHAEQHESHAWSQNEGSWTGGSSYDQIPTQSYANVSAKTYVDMSWLGPKFAHYGNQTGNYAQPQDQASAWDDAADADTGSENYAEVEFAGQIDLQQDQTYA